MRQGIATDGRGLGINDHSSPRHRPLTRLFTLDSLKRNSFTPSEGCSLFPVPSFHHSIEAELRVAMANEAIPAQASISFFEHAVA
jgi:hypothetical protein